tara:strand:+ start:691 stop:1011 length:321 start_codon:yes stop_codon:yes gene_type:complete
MARTSKSRNADGFSMRSGNSPMNLFGLGKTKVGKFVNKAIKKNPVSMAINALKGGGNDGSGGVETQNVAGGEENTEQKINEIHAALVSEDETGIGNSMTGQAEGNV